MYCISHRVRKLFAQIPRVFAQKTHEFAVSKLKRIRPNQPKNGNHQSKLAELGTDIGISYPRAVGGAYHPDNYHPDPQKQIVSQAIRNCTVLKTTQSLVKLALVLANFAQSLANINQILVESLQRLIKPT